MYIVTRPTNGISINGKESLLNDHGDILKFNTGIDAKIYLEDNGIWAKDMEKMGIQIEKEGV